MTPAEALQYLQIAAKAEKVQLTKTAQTRLLYLTDLRAHRYGCQELSGLIWERAGHGPFNRSVSFLPRKVDVDLSAVPPWSDHARAVVAAYGRVSHEELGIICNGSAPMRKAPRRGDVLDLDATSTNDLTSAVTSPPT